MSLNMVKLSEIIPKAISGEWGDDVGEIKVLRTTNFQNDGTINYSNVVTRSISQKKIDQKTLKFGDTIIEKSGGSPSQPVGRVVYFDKKEDIFLCNNFTSVLRPSSTVDSKYVFWFLFNNHLTGKTLNYQNKTTGIINLKLERYLQELQIPLPPSSTQKRIAEILDKADSLRKKNRQLLQSYNDLSQSLFINMFGDPVKNKNAWEVKMLNEISTHIVDCPHSTPQYIEMQSDYPCIRTSELVNGQIKWESMKYVDEVGYVQRIKALRPQPYDIIYGREGSFGDAVLIPENVNICLGQRTMLFRPNKNLANPFFFWFQLRGDAIYNQALRQTKGSTVGHINVGDIKKFKAILPPMALQNDFAKQIENIEQQKGKVKAQLQESENLFQALLQQAFNGGLN